MRLLRLTPGKGARLLTTAAVLLAMTAAGSDPVQAQESRPSGQQGRLYGGPIRKPEAMLEMNVADGFTIASVGDTIHSRPIAQNPETGSLKALIAAADVATANCECVFYDIRENRLPVNQQYHLWPLVMHPSVAQDLAALGFDLVSRANNQTMGYGIEGMHETDRVLDEVGIEHAGTGLTATHARAARYFDTPRGRVAMVSMTSTFDDWNRAVDPSGDVAARPGLSGLRLTEYKAVSAEEMKALRAILAARPAAAGVNPFLARTVLASDELQLFGQFFKERDPKLGNFFKMNEGDKQSILKAIRNGKANADFLVATIHSHEQGPDTQDFLIQLAHESIDNGADSFVGHGPHALRGIEIYKGKPIFYSLGDFAWAINMTAQPAPPDYADQRDIDLSKVTNAEYTAIGWDHWDTPEEYEAVVAVTRFEKNRLAEIRLYPIEMGHERARAANRGYPRLASPQAAQKILADLQRLSSCHGTKITIEKNVGVIRPGA